MKTPYRAFFSRDRIYRYGWWHRVAVSKHPLCVNFIMLNPSTADESHVDPTVRRCAGYARAWGYDYLAVTNLFAFRATDPRALKTVDDPVGPRNDGFLRMTAKRADLVVAAWGNHGALHARSAAVRKLLRGVPLTFLSLTKTGEPSHPLYLPSNLVPVEWTYHGV